MSDVVGYSGFEILSETIQKYIDCADDVMDVLEVGAKEFVNDALKLPKPISKIHKAGYTHLVNSFAYRKKNNEIEARLGKILWTYARTWN